MSNTKTVKKLTSIDTTLEDIKEALSGSNNWKQLFCSHAINTDQSLFEQYHIVTAVANGVIDYTNNPEKGVEIQGDATTANTGIAITSTFRLPYLTKRMMVCFSHEVSVAATDIDVTNLVLTAAADTPIVSSDGFGFFWNADAADFLNIRFGSTNIAQANFNKDILNGSGDSGITLSRRDGVFTTFVIFDITVNKCIQYGIKCNGKNYIIHEEKDINDGVLTLANSGQLYTSMFDVGSTVAALAEVGYFRGWDVMGFKEIDDCLLDTRHPYLAPNSGLSIAASTRVPIGVMRYKTSPVDNTLRNVYPDKISIYGCGLFEVRINYLGVATDATGTSGGSNIAPTVAQIELFSNGALTADVLLNNTSTNEHVVYYEVANNYTNIDLKKILWWYNYGFTNLGSTIRTEVVIEITNLNDTAETFYFTVVWRES